MRNKTLTAGLMTAFSIACGPQGEQPTLDEGDSVATVTQASSDADSFIDREPIQNASKLVAELGKVSDEASKVANILGKANTYFSVAVTALQMLGYLQSEADIEQARFDALHEHLDQLGVKLTEVILANYRDDRLSMMRTSVNNINVFAQRGGGRIDESLLSGSELVELGNARTDSQYAAQRATELSAHQGYYYESVTNGDYCGDDWTYDNDCWKHWTSGRPTDRTIAYDWRLGTAEMLQLIASRLAIIGVLDPNFRSNAERMEELRQYRESLEGYYTRMVDGIHCYGAHGGPVQVWCADVYTGAAMSTTFVDRYCNENYNKTKCDALIAPHIDRLKRSIMTRMPLFQVRAMINALNANRTTDVDLTTNPRIRMPGTQNCVKNYETYEYETDPYQPTVVPGVWSPGMATCSSSDVAQEWHYNRETGQIKNAWGACLGQRSFDIKHPYYGNSLWVEACTNSGAQHWTWDPSTRVLENAFHTVLGAPPQFGTYGPPSPRAELRGASATQTWESPPLENLALNKPAYQTTTVWGYPDATAAKANDGNRDGWFWNGSVSHTSNGFYYYWLPDMPGQFWQVSLSPNFGPGRHVKRVDIYNRTDCCAERLSHYNVLAWIDDDDEWRVISNHANETTNAYFTSLDVGDVFTRYVMVVKTDDDYLQLAEVEVMGY
jgi:hypothetical protein